MKNISKKQLKKITVLAKYWGFMDVRLLVMPNDKKSNGKSNSLQIVIKNNKEILIDKEIARQICLLFELTELLGCKIILLTEKELYPQDLKNINKHALHLNKPQEDNKLKTIKKAKFTPMDLTSLNWEYCIEKEDVEGLKKELNLPGLKNQKNINNDKEQSLFIEHKKKDFAKKPQKFSDPNFNKSIKMV
jgi:hypothetical protein